MERHYLLQGANEVMPYRVYVPTGYTPARRRRWSSRCTASAATRTRSSTSTTGAPATLAEQHGFLMAAPLGYRVDGFYGCGDGQRAADAADAPPPRTAASRTCWRSCG